MTQNKKKGIAKKALSVSLVAAMLATSNVPAWASGFTAESYDVASQGFAPADDGGMPMLQATSGSITLGTDLNEGSFDLYNVQNAANAKITADPTADTNYGYYSLVLVVEGMVKYVLDSGEAQNGTATDLGYDFATNSKKVTAGTYTVDVYYGGAPGEGSTANIGTREITITDHTPEAPVGINDVLQDTSAVISLLNTAIAWNDTAAMGKIGDAANGLQTKGSYNKVSGDIVFINGTVDSNGQLTAGSEETGSWSGSTFQEHYGETVAVKVVVSAADGTQSTFYLATSDGKVGNVDISTAAVKGWEVTINGQTYSDKDTDRKIAIADAYNVTSATLYLDDARTVAVNLKDVDTGITLTASSAGAGAVDDTINVSIEALPGNEQHLTNTYNIASVATIVGKSLESLVSFNSGSLSYDPDQKSEDAIKSLLDDDVVEISSQLEASDYEVKLYQNNTGNAYVDSAIVQAGQAWIGVEGKGDYAGQKVISDAPITVAAKDLSTLAEVQNVIDGITWTSEADVKTAIDNALETIVKFDSAANAKTFDLTAPANTKEVKVDVEYPEEAGEEAVITLTPVSGNTNYTGTKVIRFTPKVNTLPAGVADALQTAMNGAGWTYDAKSHVVNNLITKDLGEISRSQYTLSVKEKPVSEIKDAGTYTIVMAVNSGVYAGMTAEATLKVSERDVTKLFDNGVGVSANEITYNPDGYGSTKEKLEAVNPQFTYNGEVLDANDMTPAGITVTIAYNAEAGDDVTVSFTGAGNYKGTANVTVGTIQRKDLNDLELPEIPTQEYGKDYSKLANIMLEDETGTEKSYGQFIVDGKKKTVLTNSDYLVSIDVPDNGTGTATVTLRGKGNYTGTVVKTFEITKNTITADIGTMTTATQFANVIADQEYSYTKANSKNGISLTFATASDATSGIIVRDRETGKNVAAHCDITYTNNRAAGTATVEATGKDGYDIYATATFVITPKVMRHTISLVQDDNNGTKDHWNYTGEEITPQVAANYTDDAYALVEGVDYEVAYSNNVEAKNATDEPTVTVTGLGNYVFGDAKNNGVEKKFTIDKVVLGNVNVVVNDVEYAGGLQVTPDITIYNPETMKAIPADHFNFEFTKGGTNAGQAVVEITLTEKGEKGYEVTPAIEVSFMVNKKALSSCDVIVENGVVTVKNGEITVPASEYTVKDNGDGTYTVTANADSNYTGSVTAAESVPETPGATVLSVAERTTSTVTMNWDKVDGAEGYTIWYRSEYDTEMSRKIIFDGEQTSWTLKGLQPGTKYFFAMRSWVKDAEGNYIFSDVSPTQRGTTKPLAATIIGVTVTDGKIKVRLAGEAEGAEMYSMCYGDSRACFKENDFKVGIRTQYTTRTLNKTFEPGTYYVCVKSYRDLGNNKRVYGEWSNTFRAVVK